MCPKDQPRYVTINVNPKLKELLMRDKRKYKKKNVNDVVKYHRDLITSLMTELGVKKPDQLIPKIKQNLSISDESTDESQEPTTKPRPSIKKIDNKCPFRAVTQRKEDPIDCARLFSKKGKIIKLSEEACDKCYERQQYVLRKKTEVKKPEKPEEPELETSVSKYEKSIEEIVAELGVCENPIVMRQRPMLCVLCKKRNFAKWQACQEIQKELKESPIEYRKYVQAKIEATKNPSPMAKITAKTQSMTIQEIEIELGLTNPSMEDRRFDIMNKYFHELCENCDELLHHRCTHYCKKFLEACKLEAIETTPKDIMVTCELDGEQKNIDMDCQKCNQVMRCQTYAKALGLA